MVYAARGLFLICLFSFLPAAFASVSLIESSAFVEGSELQVKMMLSNDSAEDNTVKIEVNYLGQLDTAVETVPGNSTKLLTYKISSIKPGEVRFALLSDSNRFVKVVVPEDYDSRNALLVHEIGATEWKNRLPSTDMLSGFAAALKHLASSPDATAVAVVLLIAVAVLLFLKILFRKKSDAEKQARLNEKLLQEANEIEAKRNRVNQRIKP